MKQTILKQVEAPNQKRNTCKGCVFSDNEFFCHIPDRLQALYDYCLINEKYYIWVFDRIEGEDEQAGKPI